MNIKSFVTNLIQRKFNKLLYKGSDYSQLGEQMVVINILGRIDQPKLNKIYVAIRACHPSNVLDARDSITSSLNKNSHLNHETTRKSY